MVGVRRAMVAFQQNEIIPPYTSLAEPKTQTFFETNKKVFSFPPHPMSWPIDSNVANLISILGSCFTILMWLAPMKEIWFGKESVFKTKGEKHPSSSLSYVAGVATSFLWALYQATHLDTMLIAFFVNCLGTVLNVAFVGCFFVYVFGPTRITMKKETLVFSITIFLAILSWIITGTTDLLGYFAMLCNISSKSC